MNDSKTKLDVNSKLSIEDRVIEYINLLLKNTSFQVKSDEQEYSFSDGKKISSFFIDHHKEIVNRLFSNSEEKTNTRNFIARAKVIDYMMSIGSKQIKRIEDSFNLVLLYLNDFNNIEDIIRCVSISMSEDGDIKYEKAMTEYMDAYNYNDSFKYSLETYMNNSGMDFAMSIEKVFKSLIIFRECLKNGKYTYSPSNYQEAVANKNGDNNLIIGTTKWRESLNKKGGVIRSEASLLELIKENTQLPTLDKRVFIERVKSTAGHDLYSLYQLLDPVSKLIVNSEFYIYDPNNPDNRDKDIGMYAVLTKNIQYHQAGTSDIEQSLDKYSNDFVKARYADIDLDSIKPDELDFLKRLATALNAYSIYKFPISKQYDGLDFTKVNFDYLDSTITVNSKKGQYKILKYPFFCKLDKVSKYYLLLNFNFEEIDLLNDHIKKMQANNYDYIQLEQFINLAIFFKHFVVENLKMQLEFEDIVLNNLLQYFDNIKDFDLFNGASNNLFLNSFFTKENVEKLKNEIETLKQNKSKKEDLIKSSTKQDKSINDKIDEFIEMLTNPYYTSYVNGEPDENNVFKIGHARSKNGSSQYGLGVFWLQNIQQIIARLKEKYQLLKSKENKTANDQMEIMKIFNAIEAINNHKFYSSIDAKVKVFIEMLGDDAYTGYDKNGRPNSNNILFKRNIVPFKGFESISGLNTADFWHENARRVYAKLFLDEEYQDKKYDKARDAIKRYSQKYGISLPSFASPSHYNPLIIDKKDQLLINNIKINKEYNIDKNIYDNTKNNKYY